MLEIIKDVKVIKTAILKSRYIAARLANGEMLKLYFAIGGYVSTNSFHFARHCLVKWKCPLILRYLYRIRICWKFASHWLTNWAQVMPVPL